MNLILTSNLPTTPIEAVFQAMREGRGDPRIAWVPPFTDPGHQRFQVARKQFLEYGFEHLEYCDIDAECHDTQIVNLGEYDVVYLSV